LSVRIVCMTDIHGAFDVAEEIARRQAGSDVLILGGDITNVGTPEAVEELTGRLRPHAGCIVAVAGNMDPSPIDASLVSGKCSLNGRGITVGEVGFHGVSGGPISLGTPNELPESEIALVAEAGHRAVSDAPTRVFVPHAPPHGCVDRIASGQSVGSTAVREHIDSRHPHAVFCGHIHEARGVDRLGDTLVVNCGLGRRGEYAVGTVQDGLVQAELHSV